MRRFATLAVLLLASAIALPAGAAKPVKWKELGPMAAEVGGEALADDDLKAMKAADRCANADKTWMRAMEPEQQTGIDMLHEMLAAPVTCWSGAAKKASKASEAFAPVGAYATAQEAYAKTLREYIFALQAKYIGDRLSACKRFKVAIAEAATASQAVEGVIDGFTSTEAKTIAAVQAQNIKGMVDTIADEFATQKCD